MLRTGLEVLIGWAARSVRWKISQAHRDGKHASGRRSCAARLAENCPTRRRGDRAAFVRMLVAQPRIALGRVLTAPMMHWASRHETGLKTLPHQ